MKVQYKLQDIPVKDFETWRHQQGLEVTVRERAGFGPNDSPYYATIEDAEIQDRSVLISVMGNGVTVQGAIQDLAKEIQGKVLVVDAFRPTRREVKVPHKLEVEFE